MAKTIPARLDERAEADLAILRNEGHNDSEAIRPALREVAERRRRRSALRLEAEHAASDPDDVAEALRLRREMDALAAPWPTRSPRTAPRAAPSREEFAGAAAGIPHP